jgi:hypothetical protein
LRVAHVRYAQGASTASCASAPPPQFIPLGEQGSSSEEISLTSNNWIRQTHRWVSIAFTVAVIVNIVALVQQSSASWVGFLALPPLALLLFTGLYLFVLPYATKWRSARSADRMG